MRAASAWLVEHVAQIERRPECVRDELLDGLFRLILAVPREEMVRARTGLELPEQYKKHAQVTGHRSPGSAR